jgi:hypothetical protein
MRSGTVHGVRAVVLWLVRAAGVALILFGVYLVGARLAFAVLGTGRVTQAWGNWMGLGEDHGVFRGLPMIAVGVVLASGSRRLATWIVAAPGSGCPRCGYETSATPGPCAECGWREPDRAA